MIHDPFPPRYLVRLQLPSGGAVWLMDGSGSQIRAFRWVDSAERALEELLRMGAVAGWVVDLTPDQPERRKPAYPPDEQGETP